MPICGLVITLIFDGEGREQTLARLRAEPDLELGEARGPRLPAVLEVQDRAALGERWDGLLGISGVAGLTLAYASYEGDGAGEAEETAP